LGVADWIVYALIGLAVIASPFSWLAEERKRARKRTETAGSGGALV